MFVGIPSYNRARILQNCIGSFFNSKVVRGFIIVAQGTSEREYSKYTNLIKQTMDAGFEVIYMLTNKRLGSTSARNKVLELSINSLSKSNILVMYDDDFVYPGDYALVPVLPWLRRSSVGLVGGRVINLRTRQIDPDFFLNISYLADALTRLTGFIVLDIKHGPREVEYTTHPLAMRVEIIDKGVRYDENYGGTGYREESDFQRQIRELGYKIIFELRFYTYHLAIESGGNRYFDIMDRMYWKWRNHTYFMNKWNYPLHKRILSYAILTSYALLNGSLGIKGIIQATKVRR